MSLVVFDESIAKRFWPKVKKTPSCWLWLGSTNPTGYGQISYKNAPRLAHRVSYYLANGPFEANLFCCHKCDNPACVNPGHLFLGTQKVNVVDMISKGRFVHFNSLKSRCKRGHPLTGKNLRIISRNGRKERHCRVCSYAKVLRWQTENKIKAYAEVILS